MKSLRKAAALCYVVTALSGCGRERPAAAHDPRGGVSPASDKAAKLTATLEHAKTAPSLSGIVRLAKHATSTQAALVPTPARVRRKVGQRFAVSTAHPLATQAGLNALKRGGSAVDALVAASVMLTVVTPHSTGIGGGGFAVIWPGKKQAPQALDFREQAPRDSRLKHFLGKDGEPVAKRSQRHGLAVGVPGYVAGLWALHQRWGKLPWASLFKPALDAAERGFVMGPHLVHAAQVTWDDLGPVARLLLSPRSAGAPSSGASLRQVTLAKTLRGIAVDGPGAFYRGAVALDIVETVRQMGGHMSIDDLAQYRPRWVAPLRGPAFGGEVLTMPQPSAGGAQLLAMAALTQKFMRGRRPSDVDAAAAHALVEAMRASFLLRLAFSGDSTSTAKKLHDVYPKRHVERLSRRFSALGARGSERIEPRRLPKHSNTSHVSVVDGDGMAVASTHTINLLFGSGIVSPKAGVWLNNEMDDFSFSTKTSNAFGLAGSDANLYRPGARPVSSMTPSIFLKEGAPRLVIGAPGGTRIPTAVFQVAWRHLKLGQPLMQAVDAPRLHHQAFPDEVWVEAGAGASKWRSPLKRLGHVVVERDPWCDVQSVSVTQRPRRLEAVSDGRYDGSAGAE